MKNRFTIRRQKEDESKDEYIAYIMDEVKKNMPFYGKDEKDMKERLKDYVQDLSGIATFLNNQMYPEDALVTDSSKYDKAQALKKIFHDIRARKSGESDVDYMDYIMNLAKEKMPFATDKSGADRQKEYALYMDEIYKIASVFYEHMEKKAQKKKRLKKKSKKRLVKRRKKGIGRKILSTVGSVLKTISKVLFYIEPEEFDAVSKDVSKPKKQKKVKKSVDVSKKDMDEDLEDILEIDEQLVSNTGYDHVHDDVLSQADERIVIPDVSSFNTNYVKKDSSVLDSKRDFNDIVEKFVQDRMIPGPITEDMNMADILDVMYPTSHKPLEYGEIQEYVELWQWELSMKEEHEKHAKVLTK